MTTNKQKSAIKFCEFWTKVEFTGDIHSFKEVSNYLSIYLDTAKAISEDAISSYYSNFDY